MDRQIKEIMQAVTKTVLMNDTIENVEHTLTTNHLSSVPVMDPNRGDCFGIISAKDLVQFHDAKKNSKDVRAWEVCSHKLFEVSQETSVKEAAELMINHDVHHLVVGHGKSMKGFISSLDLLRLFTDGSIEKSVSKPPLSLI